MPHLAARLFCQQDLFSAQSLAAYTQRDPAITASEVKVIQADFVPASSGDGSSIPLL
jgi:hypothetical protein